MDYNYIRKTKIICTMGPSTESDDVIRNLMIAGMNVARFNFSHSNHEGHKKMLERVVRIREELGLPVATLLDTKGPEIRICEVGNCKVALQKDQIFTLTTDERLGDISGVQVNCKNLPRDLKPGSIVLIDDGLVELSVIDIKNNDIICQVKNGGTISDNKGINVPGTALSMPYISQKDREDILFGIENGFDFIAASFTRTADDILHIRKIFDEENCNTIKIIAKIENLQGVENIDEIIAVSDGIMIARGDMGVEIPLEEVPAIQKRFIKKAYNAGKQVITATQMLDSMMKNPRPTRAETTDVANAIYDGTSAIMLSGETAAGLFPVESVKTMVKIAIRTEQDIDYIKRFKNMELVKNNDVTNAIAHATCTTAHDLNASAIITVTKTGRTARMISKFRPNSPIIGCSSYPQVCRQMNLSWGVTPLLVDEKDDADDLLAHAADVAEKTGLVSQGEIVVMTVGVPIGISGTTNIMKVHLVGHILITGTGVTSKSVCANLCVCKDENEVTQKFKESDIIVIPFTTNALLPYIKKSSGIISEQIGLNSHAAVCGLSLDLPVLVGADSATKILKSGTTVTLDAEKGIVIYS